MSPLLYIHSGPLNGAIIAASADDIAKAEREEWGQGITPATRPRPRSRAAHPAAEAWAREHRIRDGRALNYPTREMRAEEPKDAGPVTPARKPSRAKG